MPKQKNKYWKVALDDIQAGLSPDHIIGILVWAVLRGELTNEVVQMAQSLPKEYYDGLDGEWWLVEKEIHSRQPMPWDDETLAYVREMLAMEIPGIVYGWASERILDELVDAVMNDHLTEKNIREARLITQTHWELLGDNWLDIGMIVNDYLELPLSESDLRDYQEILRPEIEIAIQPELEAVHE
jgi:hypothetical protein